MIGLCFFTSDSPEFGVRRHLWVVLGGPCPKTGRIVMANLSTTPCPSGETCTVNRDEHDQLSRMSHLRFDNVTVAKASNIKELLATKHCSKTTEASAKLTEKMQKAVSDSKVVPQEAIAIISDSLLTARNKEA